MSMTKRWLEENVPKLSIRELLDMGYRLDVAVWLKSIFNY